MEFQWVTKTASFSPKASALAPELHPDVSYYKNQLKHRVVLIFLESF
jgi:hypothetical protein